MTKITLLFFLLILLCLISCTDEKNSMMPLTVAPVTTLERATATDVPPTQTSTAVVTPISLPTPTSTPVPTNTPIPYTTVQPFPTVTPVGVYPTKQIFIQAGLAGGDGGSAEDVYLGRGAPSIAIYTDGQVIMKIGSRREGFSFFSGQLPLEELCSLLANLESTGYFNPVDMIYAFDETTQFSDGAGSYVIQVNGPINKSVDIYWPYVNYLVDEIAPAYHLISTYQPPMITTPYIPDRLLLWVEPFTSTDSISVLDWPIEITPLAELQSDPSSSKIIIEGDMILPLMELFNFQMTQQIFREGDRNYKVILRPLLPDETPDSFPTLFYSSTAFNLPFSCKDMTLPKIIASPTPTPLASNLASQAKSLRGRIVFASDRDGNFEIYTMYADGGNITRLTNYPGSDTEPTWSPDGQKIAFVSDRSGRNEIYVMNADGTNVERLTFSASDKYSPSWSPEGSRIVYVNSHNAKFPDFDTEIHMVGLENNDQLQLTDTGSRINDLTPIWLDIEQIMYASGDYPDYRLYMMQDDGSGSIRLGNGLQPALSPNGKQLAYVEANKIYTAFMADLNSNHYPSAQITEIGMQSDSPAWSPDGQQIVFISTQDGNSEIYVINSDGSNPIRLTFTAATEQSPDWAP